MRLQVYVIQMPILIKIDLGCNFSCNYCYQRFLRGEEKLVHEPIDHVAVKDTVKRLWSKEGVNAPKTKEERKKYDGPTIVLHGGEPTMLPIEVFKDYLELSYELTGKSSIQTNGYNITDEMIIAFKKYNTHVGMSIDGPYPLNELRGFGTPEQRKKQTERILRNMDRLLKEDIGVSVISVIHKHNALGERREILKDWIKELSEKGITGRLNPCCSGIDDIDLTVMEAIEVYDDLYNFMIENGYHKWSPFKDIINSIKRKGNVVCVYRDCDPFCTRSAISVLHDGSTGVCLRLYGDTPYLRGSNTGIRSKVLEQTDCKDCKWWEHCYGGCTGLAIDFDWRNKDRYCELYKHLFKRTDNLLKSVGIDPEKQKTGKSKPKSFDGYGAKGDHTDGIAHIDGEFKHLDGYN